MAVVVFERDDAGFLRWIEEHPGGYVLNCYPTGRVHSACCRSYRSAGPRMTYKRAKACGTSERRLFEYAEQHRINATRCERC